MKKLSFLQAYEKHIEKVKKHWLTIASVLAVWVLGTLGYQWYQDASYAKTIANKSLLQDMGFIDTPIKVAPVKNIKDVIAIDEPIDTLLTWVYTWGDIIISAASFTQTLPNGTVWPINTIISTGSNAPVAVNITLKNIGTMPLYIPIANQNGNDWIFAMQCQWPSQWWGCFVKVPLSSLTQWRYLLAGQSIQWTITNSIHWGWFWYPYTNTSLTFTVNSQQQQWRSPVQPSMYQTILFETNGQNNTFTINYTVPSTSNPINTGVLEPIEIENPIWIVRKWFDLKIKDINATYNQLTNKLLYTFKLVNLWNKNYNLWWTGNNAVSHIVINAWSTNWSSDPTLWFIWQNNMPCNYNCQFLWGNGTFYPLRMPVGFVGIWNNNSINISFEAEPVGIVEEWLPHGTYTMCNKFYVWKYNLIATTNSNGIVVETNNSNILPEDLIPSNNSTTYCTTFTKANWTNPSTWSNGNTYGYGYGYQPGYGYGYGYGYKTQYASKSNFFYLTKPYMMISEKVYKVFKDQYTVMKKLKKGTVEKLFDKKTLQTMRTDVMKYLKKEINKAQNKTKGMREKIAEIQKISKLYTQFTKDYNKRIESKK